jgi:hypothetical protein
METADKAKHDDGGGGGGGGDDDEKVEITTPKSHSVHWLAVLKKLNESARSFKMDLDDLSLMEIPEQVLSNIFDHFIKRCFSPFAGICCNGTKNTLHSV